ncbi:MAG: hypothetical protein KAH01_01550, partial [Caldisericia bacterium]|nr:hypothetical protein [Caldisericia bacterium]
TQFIVRTHKYVSLESTTLGQGINWEATLYLGRLDVVVLAGIGYFYPKQKLLTHFSKFGLGRKTTLKFCDFLMDCELSAHTTSVECIVVKTEDGCHVDCECFGSGGSLKRRL